jgi:catechol 2,3-dioxygenase-like lactoylglutathione lyase family enzyme
LIRRVHHLPVYVEDFEGSLKFLVNVMGFKVVGTPVDAREKVRLLKAGSDLIEVLDAKIFGRRCVAAFYVDSVEEELRSLREKGVELEELSEVGVYKMKEGTHRNVFFRMKGREKLNSGWVELIEPIDWNPWETGITRSFGESPSIPEDNEEKRSEMRPEIRKKRFLWLEEKRRE